MSKVDLEKVVALVNITNELTKRVQDYMSKEAHYTEHAKEIVDEIIDNLIEAKMVDSDKAESLKESLLKSASSAIDTLYKVSKNINEMAPPIGQSYNYISTNMIVRGNKGNKSKVVEYEGFVIDPAKYL